MKLHGENLTLNCLARRCEAHRVRSLKYQQLRFVDAQLRGHRALRLAKEQTAFAQRSRVAYCFRFLRTSAETYAADRLEEKVAPRQAQQR